MDVQLGQRLSLSLRFRVEDHPLPSGFLATVITFGDMSRNLRIQVSKQRNSIVARYIDGSNKPPPEDLTSYSMGWHDVQLKISSNETRISVDSGPDAAIPTRFVVQRLYLGEGYPEARPQNLWAVLHDLDYLEATRVPAD